MEAFGLVKGDMKDGPSGGWRNNGADRGHSFTIINQPEKGTVSIDESGRWEYLVGESFDGVDPE